MAPSLDVKKEGGEMKKTTLILAVSAVLAACATEEAQKPAATAPKPAPASPAPAPAPVPRATQDIQIGQGSAAAPAPKKPAVTNERKSTLDREVIGKLKELGQIRYINVGGHADRLGSVQYNQ